MKELSKQRTKEEDQNNGKYDEKKVGKFINGSDFE